MADVKGFESVVAQLRERAAAAKADAEASVVVGYTASYALYVHEDTFAKHKKGQAKFLEEPARALRDVLAGIVRESLGRKNTMAQALLLAGLRLQRESMKLVPIDTGILRASAFTRLE